jgi:hypothetical protein
MTFVFRIDGQNDDIREQLRPVPDRRWVPVSARLPIEGGRPRSVLLYLDHRDGYGSQAVGYFLGGEFWLYEDGNITCDKAGVDVLYWMPLPTPPEGVPPSSGGQ